MNRHSRISPFSKKRAAEFAAKGWSMNSTFAPTQRRRSPNTSKATVAGPDANTVEAVLERDHWSCVSCGVGLFGDRGVHWSIQHRVARGAGGTSRQEVNSPASLIALCGSGVTGCHGRVEKREGEDERRGYWVRRDRDGKPVNPALVPVKHATHGWVLLDDQGGWIRCAPAVAA